MLVEFFATFPLEVSDRGCTYSKTIWLNVRKFRNQPQTENRQLYLADASSSSGFGGVPAFTQSRSRSRSLSREAGQDAHSMAEHWHVEMKAQPTLQQERVIYKRFVKTWHPDLVGRTGNKYDVKFATAVFQHFMNLEV